MISKQALLDFIIMFPDNTYFLPCENEKTGTLTISANDPNYNWLGFIENITEKVVIAKEI